MTRVGPDPAPRSLVDTPTDADVLRVWLDTRDARCPLCDYNLRGLQSTRCPECAAELHLQIGSDNLRIGPWLVAVIGPALALGFDGVVSILMALGLALNPPKFSAEVEFILMILGAFLFLAGACIAGIIVLVRRRPRWNRLPMHRQWWLGFGIFLFVGLAHAAFGWALFTRLF